MNESELQSRLDFVRRAEQLKDTLRSGYTSAGRTESVADHTWRLTLLVMTFADMLPDVNLLRLLKICVLHDLGEAVDGDIPAPLQVGQASKSDKERSDFQSLLQGLPASLQAEFLDLWDDYEFAQSEEAKVAKGLDKIETLMQHNQGSNPPDFDYAFNLDYGRQHTDAVALTANIRRLLDAQTRVKANNSARPNGQS